MERNHKLKGTNKYTVDIYQITNRQIHSMKHVNHLPKLLSLDISHGFIAQVNPYEEQYYFTCCKISVLIGLKGESTVT